MSTPIAFVTGAASGIGRNLCDSLIQRGYRVFAADLQKSALHAAASQGGWPSDRSVLHELDVRDPAQWESSLQECQSRFGVPDLLLNVAGVLVSRQLVDTSVEEIDRVIDVNLKGLIHGTRCGARAMLPRGSGHIVNIASLAGVAPIPGMSIYTASKYAVRGFTLAAAQELLEKGIHLSCVCPDAVRGPMTDVMKDNEDAALLFSGQRMLSMEEVNRAILDHVVPRKPLMTYLPRSRAWMAQVADLFPAVTRLVGPSLRKKGLKAQRALREPHTS